MRQFECSVGKLVEGLIPEQIIINFLGVFYGAVNLTIQYVPDIQIFTTFNGRDVALMPSALQISFAVKNRGKINGFK